MHCWHMYICWRTSHAHLFNIIIIWVLVYILLQGHHLCTNHRFYSIFFINYYRTNCMVDGSWFNACFFGFCSPHLHLWNPPPPLFSPTVMTTRKTTAETIGWLLNPSLHWWPFAHAKETLTWCPSENSCEAITCTYGLICTTLTCSFTML